MNQIQQNFESPATEIMLQQVAERIRERNIEVLIVNNGEEARQVVLERLPKGSEVHSGKSKTLQDSGIFDALQDPNQFNALRHQMLRLYHFAPFSNHLFFQKFTRFLNLRNKMSLTGKLFNPHY